jgi:nitrogen fixation protein FixH
MKTAQSISNPFSWWPRVIIGFFVFFALYIGNFVRMALKTDVDLVSKDYYQKEIVYQQHLNTIAQTKEKGAQIQLALAEAAGQLAIVFPAFFEGQPVGGTVKFFRPSDAKLDFELPLKPNEAGQQFILVGALQKGLWKVQVSSKVNGKSYFTEQTITLK